MRFLIFSLQDYPLQARRFHFFTMEKHLCARVKIKCDLAKLLEGLPERDQVEQYLDAGGAFYFDQTSQDVESGKVEVFFYLFDATHYFYLDRDAVEFET